MCVCVTTIAFMAPNFKVIFFCFFIIRLCALFFKAQLSRATEKNKQAEAQQLRAKSVVGLSRVESSRVDFGERKKEA